MAQIGKLDRRITFQDFTVDRKASGQEVKTWRDLPSVPTVWASIEFLPGGSRSEDFEADQKTAINKVIFFVRYREDITEEMRIKDEFDKFYDITHIGENNVHRKRYLKINAVKKD